MREVGVENKDASGVQLEVDPQAVETTKMGSESLTSQYIFAIREIEKPETSHLRMTFLEREQLIILKRLMKN